MMKSIVSGLRIRFIVALSLIIWLFHSAIAEPVFREPLEESEIAVLKNKLKKTDYWQIIGYKHRDDGRKFALIVNTPSLSSGRLCESLVQTAKLKTSFWGKPKWCVDKNETSWYVSVIEAEKKGSDCAKLRFKDDFIQYKVFDTSENYIDRDAVVAAYDFVTDLIDKNKVNEELKSVKNIQYLEIFNKQDISMIVYKESREGFVYTFGIENADKTDLGVSLTLLPIEDGFKILNIDTSIM